MKERRFLGEALSSQTKSSPKCHSALWPSKNSFYNVGMVPYIKSIIFSFSCCLVFISCGVIEGIAVDLPGGASGDLDSDIDGDSDVDGDIDSDTDSEGNSTGDDTNDTFTESDSQSSDNDSTGNDTSSDSMNVETDSEFGTDADVDTDIDTDTDVDTDSNSEDDRDTETGTAPESDTQTDDMDASVDSDTGLTLRPVAEIPLQFTAADSWVSEPPGFTNWLNIEGGWNSYYDGLSTISRDISIDNVVCVEGKIVPPQGPDPDYQKYFGAKVGFDLCMLFSFEFCDLDPDIAEQFAGVSFTILSGISNELPDEIRVQFWEQNRGDSPYVPISGDGDHETRIENAKLYYDPTAPPLNVNKIQSIFFYISSSVWSGPFGFCIGNIRALKYK